MIVGVVEDARYFDVRARRRRTWRIDLAPSTPDDVLEQSRGSDGSRTGRGDGALRQALAEAEPALSGLRYRAARPARQPRPHQRPLGREPDDAFRLVALLLACLGLYGTISYGVARRVDELGVRMALGAIARDVLWLVLRESMTLVVAGALLGRAARLCGQTAASASFSYGVGPLDPRCHTHMSHGTPGRRRRPGRVRRPPIGRRGSIRWWRCDATRASREVLGASLEVPGTAMLGSGSFDRGLRSPLIVVFLRNFNRSSWGRFGRGSGPSISSSGSLVDVPIPSIVVREASIEVLGSSIVVPEPRPGSRFCVFEPGATVQLLPRRSTFRANF